MLDSLDDGELISQYVSKHSQAAMRILVSRHHDRLYSRFLSELKNVADAEDMEQQLWLQVDRHLRSGKYKHEGKFPHFLSTVASNLLNTFWRGTGRQSDVFVETRRNSGGDDDRFDANDYRDPSPDEEQRYINEELVRHLATELVPALPVEQRLAWLLRHESEFWEPAIRMDWSSLAELNGIDEDRAWEIFEVARSRLMTGMNVDDEGQLIFVVWTQAQRLNKDNEYTWDYFSALLRVPTNTMKTRYRAAQKALSDGINNYTRG